MLPNCFYRVERILFRHLIAFLCCWGCTHSNILAQQFSNAGTPYRNYGGWIRSVDRGPTGARTIVSAATSPAQMAPSTLQKHQARSSYYQQFSDGSVTNFSDPPAFPPPSLPTADFASVDALSNSLNDLPTASNSMPAFRGSFEEQSSAQQNGTLNAPVSTAAYQTNPSFPPPNVQVQGSVLPNSLPPSFGPANSTMAGPMSSANSPNELGMRSVVPNNANNAMPDRQFNRGAPEPGQPSASNLQLRSVQPTVSGLPYVTAAPNQRYPTSPYLGPRNVPMYVPASFQQTTTPVYTAQSPNGQASVLPQYSQPPSLPATNSAVPTGYPTNYAQCAPGGAMGGYVPPTVTPNWNPSMYSANNSGYRPLLSLGQENYNVQLGRGLWGQPTVYVPGQYVRNFLRYLFP